MALPTNLIVIINLLNSFFFSTKSYLWFLKYRILNKLEGAYTPDGKAVSYPGNPNEPADEAEDIYIALYRVSKTSY